MSNRKNTRCPPSSLDRKLVDQFLANPSGSSKDTLKRLGKRILEEAEAGIRISRRGIRQDRDYEDFVSETATKAFQFLGTWRSDCGLGPFIYAIARNLVNSHFKSAWRNTILETSHTISGISYLNDGFTVCDSAMLESSAAQSKRTYRWIWRRRLCLQIKDLYKANNLPLPLAVSLRLCIKNSRLFPSLNAAIKRLRKHGINVYAADWTHWKANNPELLEKLRQYRRCWESGSEPV